MTDRTQGLDALKAFHAKSKAFDGARVWMAFPFLRSAIRWARQERGQDACRTALDYGCGKLTQYDKKDIVLGDTLEVIPDLQTGLGLDAIRLYDPGVAGHDELPPASAAFDVTFAVDVFEYVPKADLQMCLDELASRAKHLVFISCTWKQPGKFHKTVHGEKWDRDEAFWLETFKKAANRYSDRLWVVRMSSGSGYPKIVPRKEHPYHRVPGQDGWVPGIPGHVQEAPRDTTNLDRLGQPLPGAGEGPGSHADPPRDATS